MSTSKPTRSLEVVAYADGEPVYADTRHDALVQCQRERVDKEAVLEGGLVYFIQAAHGGPVKIGYTTNLDGRLRDLQTASPYRLVVRHLLPGSTVDEAAMHERFKAARLGGGEWFAPTAGLVAFSGARADIGEPELWSPMNEDWREVDRRQEREARRRHAAAVAQHRRFEAKAKYALRTRPPSQSIRPS